jgi:DNA polymerase I-like protein with 3'-5' exonuclease and polymerase domains
MKRVLIDIETTAIGNKNPKIWLAWTKEVGVVDSWQYWPNASALKEYLNAFDEVIAHNGIGFDIPTLNKLWGCAVLPERTVDTMIMSQLLEPSRPQGHSLAAWGEALGYPKVDYKGRWQEEMGRKEEYSGECYDNPIDELNKEYCRQDVVILEHLFEHLSSTLSTKGFSQQSLTLEHNIAWILRKQEADGFYFDTQHALNLLVGLKAEVEKIKEAMMALYPDYEVERISEKTGKVLKPGIVSFNPGSRQQVVEKLKELGWVPTKFKPLTVGSITKHLKDVIPVEKMPRLRIIAAASLLNGFGDSDDERTEAKRNQKLLNDAYTKYNIGPPEGTVELDESVLEGICKAEKEGALFAMANTTRRFLLVQKRVTQIESWVDAVGPDGRIHGRVIGNGAVTGRCTHMSPNMAQIPNASSEYGPECRQSFSAPPERISKVKRVIVGCDLSGIELRCLAHYMDDIDWQEELLNGDVHWVNAQAFGLVPKGTLRDKHSAHHTAMRDLCKTMTYATLYGAGGKQIAHVSGRTEAQGKKLIADFIKNTPPLEALINDVKADAALGYLKGLDGRLIWVRSPHSALNSLLQGAGAVVFKMWLVLATAAVKAAGISAILVASVHDETQWECDEDDAERLGKLLVECAAQAGVLAGLRCPVDAEFKIGANWRETH